MRMDLEKTGKEVFDFLWISGVWLGALLFFHWAFFG